MSRTYVAKDIQLAGVSEDDSEDKSSPKSAISVVVCGGGFEFSVCLFVISSWPLFESSDSSSLSDEVDEDELESWFESDSEKDLLSKG